MTATDDAPAVSRETSAPAWESDELNRIYGRLGNVVDLLEKNAEKVDELLTDSRAARPLLDRYLSMAGKIPPWARPGGKGKRPHE